MVPAASVVVLKNLWRAPGLQQVVHLVLLPPSQRLAQDLSCLVHVEVPGSQETQDVLVFWDLGSEEKAWINIIFFSIYLKITLLLVFFFFFYTAHYLSLVCLLKPFAKSDQTTLL